MSAFAIVSVLGWVTVLGLVVVHVQVERGVILPASPPTLVAGACTAAALVAGAWVTGFWPMLALSLLWLRTDVLKHHDPRPHADQEHRSQPWPAVLLKIEVVVIVVLLLVLLGAYARGKNADFNHRSDHSLCGLMQVNC